MNIRARILETKVLSSKISDVNRIRLSSPAIEIKPSLFLNDLIDVNTIGANDDDALLFSSSIKKFTPTDITDIRDEITTVEKVVGGFF